MKILHINFAFVQGGIDNMMNDIIRFQIANGHEVSLIILNDKTDDNVLSLLPPKVHVYKANRPPSSRNPYYLIKVWCLINLVIKPEIIHCHNGNVGKFLLLDKHPKCLTVHAMNLPTKGYDKYDHIFCISDAVKKDVLHSYATENISTVYNGIDTGLIKKKNGRLSRNPMKLVVVGRLNAADKGQDIAIEGLNTYINKYHDNNIHLTIIGDGVSQKVLQEMVIRYHLEDKIALIGAKERSWIYRHLCDYDLAIVPSRHEGFGLTIIEGYAAGIPVLSSDIDGPLEVLENGKYGFLFKSDSPDSFAEKLAEIVSSDDTELIEKCRSDTNYLCKKYSIEKTVSDYQNIYLKLVN